MNFLAKSLLLFGLVVAGKLVKQQPPEAVITIAPGTLSVEEEAPKQSVSFFTQQLYPRVVSAQSNAQPWRITPAHFTTNSVAGEYE